MTGHTLCRVGVSQAIVDEGLRLGILRHVDGEPLIDSRGLLGTGAGRTLIIRALSRHVREFDSGIVIAGVANSGSILGALLADRLGLAFVNILVDGPRSRGLHRQLEPDHALSGHPVLLVDNWIASGNSFRDAARLITDAGGDLVGAVTVSASTTFVPGNLPFDLHVGIPLTSLIN